MVKNIMGRCSLRNKKTRLESLIQIKWIQRRKRLLIRSKKKKMVRQKKKRKILKEVLKERKYLKRKRAIKG